MKKEYIPELTIFILGLLLSILFFITVIIDKWSPFYIPLPLILSICIIIMNRLCNYLNKPDTRRDIGYNYMEDET